MKVAALIAMSSVIVALFYYIWRVLGRRLDWDGYTSWRKKIYR
jgi:hypothetical protein